MFMHFFPIPKYGKHEPVGKWLAQEACLALGGLVALIIGGLLHEIWEGL